MQPPVDQILIEPVTNDVPLIQPPKSVSSKKRKNRNKRNAAVAHAAECPTKDEQGDKLKTNSNSEATLPSNTDCETSK